jgi:hypothetical protein
LLGWQVVPNAVQLEDKAGNFWIVYRC